MKLKIKGNLSIYVIKYIELICLSKLILVFDYYFKCIFLLYIWYINNMKIDGEIRKKLWLCVVKDFKYNGYLCIVIEDDVEFDKSDLV